MEVYDQAYNASLAENERQLHIWRQHLDKHINLRLEAFTESLSVPALIPIGSKILFRGSIIHTNEFMVALGANYIAKCSLKEAQALLQHRISLAKEKVKALEKEKEYLTNQLSFTTKNIFSESGQEIIEPYNEEEEKKWREKHRLNAKRHRQNANKGEDNEKTVDEIWQTLEELELKEELEEYQETDEEDDDDLTEEGEEELDSNLLKKIEDIKQKLKDLRENREQEICGTEEGLFKRLDQLEEEEELEDELDSIKSMQSDTENIQGNDTLHEKETNHITQEQIKLQTSDILPTINAKKRVSFVEELDEDDDEPNTIEINFKHDNQKLNPKGYQVPSDIYNTHQKFLNIIDKPIVPIIKNVHKVKSETHRTEMVIEEEAEEESCGGNGTNSSVNLLGDVIEHRIKVGEQIIVDSKCVSKFRAMRLARKKKMAGSE